jgi:hypothetical protein
MTRAAPPTPAPKKPRPIPGRIGGVLSVVATLIAHARQFVAGATTYVEAPEFATAAAVFGTYQLPVILHRMQRGILRALALRDYLLARAARGRNLRFLWPPYLELQPHHRPPARPAPASRPDTVPLDQPRPDPAPRQPRHPEPALLDFDDPASCHLPTPEELAAEVRRRPVGRTIAYICLDLGLVPGLCHGEFWNHVEKILRRYGGSLGGMYRVRARREATFWRERDARPETWHINWRDFRPATVRRALGCRIGEALAEGPLPVGRMPAWDARSIAVEAARENTGPLVPVPS